MRSPNELEKLKPAERRLLLEQLLRERATQSSPASASQRAVYQADRDGVAGARAVARVAPSLTPQAVRQGLSALCARHPALRTTFWDHQGQLHRRVRDATELPLEHTRAAALDEASLTLAAEALGAAPFDLEHGPLTRAALIQSDGGGAALVLVAHPIVADLATLHALLADLGALLGSSAPVPGPTPFIGGDPASAPDGMADPEDVQRSNLPVDHPQAGWGTRTALLHAPLSPGAVAQLVALGEARGGELDTVLVAATLAVLRRLGEGDELAVQFAPRGPARPRAVRLRVGPEAPFEELLSGTVGAVAASVLSAPLPVRVEASLPAAPAGPLTLDPRQQVEARVGVLLSVRAEWGAAPGLQLAFDPRRLEPRTVEGLAGALVATLEAAAQAPATPVRRLPLLTPSMRVRLLEEWNATDHPLPDQSFLSLFERQVSASPDAVAAEDATGRLTYRELDARAARWAQGLAQRGVGPEAVVALLDQRGLDLLTAILAVFKAGAAYLPLDPLHPPERIAQVLRLSGARLVVVGARLAGLLSAAAAGVPAVPTELLEATTEPLGAPSRTDGGALAYVIFTSGSTGVPKGAMVEQRGMVNHLIAKVEGLGLGPDDKVAQNASQCFDISVWQMLAPLVVGGRTVILPDEVAQDPAALVAGVERAGVRILEVVPSLLRALLEQPRLASLGRLRWMIATGEALGGDLCTRWLEQHPGVPLLNAYGPTECSDDVTHHTLARPPTGASAPIGTPILNTRLYVLDPDLQPLPPGAPGELCVGGIGVGRGYLGDPLRTAQAFVPDPFSRQLGARLYRTGDLVRLGPDGALEFLGRLDHQVKVRGFRIELQEIESSLRRLEQVADTVVLAREDRPGDKRLVAYVVPRGEVVASQLRDQLKARLPEYMVPAAFVLLEALPLSANGKVDRRALPVPPDSPSGRPVNFSSPIEELVARALADALGLPEVGPEDNFFERGGHSLLAVQVLARLRDGLGTELPVRALFEAPTAAALARRVQQQLAEGTSSKEVPLTPVPRDPAPGLSVKQEWYWFFHNLDPQSAVANVPLAFRLDGPLDPQALSAAFADLVQRHEVLRTTFELDGGRPVQRIHPSLELLLPLVDLSPLAPDAQEQETSRLLEEMATTPFDVGRGPLARALLIRHSSQRHLMALTTHHLVGDGGSGPIFMGDLRELYRARRAGVPAALAPLAVQYADYAEWDRKRIHTGTEAKIAAWREHLAGAPGLLDLPVDKPRPANVSFRGGRVELRLDSRLTQQVAALSRRAGATPFMTLLAAFQVVLSRYTGQEQLVLAAPMSGRDRTELHRMIGHMNDLILLRGDLSGAPTFLELLGRVRKDTVWAYAHQDAPMKDVVALVRPPQGGSFTSPLQVSFGLLAGELPSWDEVGLKVRYERHFNHTTMYPLALDLWEDGGSLAGELKYASDLYEASTIQRMVQHFLQIVEGAIATPDRPVEALPFLTPMEEQRLFHDWNQTAAARPEGALVHRLFEAQVARTPDAPAVRFEGLELTYAELDTRANRLAHLLQARGVGPERRVGVLVLPSLESIVCLYAVLKAGGAYVPLDPDAPPERLSFVLQNAQVDLVLTQGGLASSVPPGPQVLRVDDPETFSRSLPAAAPGCEASPENLAYIIYTSGSTGEPKGVCVSHRAVVNHNLGVAHRFGLGPGDRMLQFTPLYFDAAGEEIYPPLLSGACTVIRGELVPTFEFGALIEQEGLTVLSLPPAYLHEWVTELAHRGERIPSCLRLVILGGEKLVPETFRLWRQVGGEEIPWINVYGPTEATVTAAMCEISAKAYGLDAPVLPIGGPVENGRIHLLDRRLRPVPVGHPGELFIAGDGLARGYSDRSDLTAERFLPNPFARVAGERMYRTGDLARYLPDGRLVFLGRVDHQVKIRGMRVELGEVEAAVRKVPGLQEVVVIVREDTPGDQRLVAYAVPEPGVSMGTAELRAQVSRTLPEYMVPSAFVALPLMPLTANGKIDRKALPPPFAEDTQRRDYQPPRTETERGLAELFAQTLGVPQVGIHDDFFALGGHSLLAIQLVARVEEALGPGLQLRHLFDGPTVAQAAQVIQGPDGAGREKVDQMSEDQLDALLEELQGSAPGDRPEGSGS
ncbi:MAG: amino acid adenylation domain-containing protein [Myxococcota bacterium]|nr:amino acid adenylation domain-containing protein [Myxococcota bacterium]